MEAETEKLMHAPVAEGDRWPNRLIHMKHRSEPNNSRSPRNAAELPKMRNNCYLILSQTQSHGLIDILWPQYLAAAFINRWWEKASD
eukprot:scaffold39719_cov36-Cyclotella_meneghiniana.AAC.1